MRFNTNHLRQIILTHMGDLTHEQLAERAGVSVQTIRNLTSGKVKNPKLAIFLQVMDALDLDVLVEERT